MKRILNKIVNSFLFRLKRYLIRIKNPILRRYNRIKYINHKPFKIADLIDNSTLEMCSNKNLSTINDCRLLDDTTLITWARSDYYDLLEMYLDMLNNKYIIFYY